MDHHKGKKKKSGPRPTVEILTTGHGLYYVGRYHFKYHQRFFKVGFLYLPCCLYSLELQKVISLLILDATTIHLSNNVNFLVAILTFMK